MLKRSNTLNITQLKGYLKSIVREFVEKPGKVKVTSESFPNMVLYHVAVHIDDLPIIEQYQKTCVSLDHIMNKATHANIGKNGRVDNQFGISQ